MTPERTAQLLLSASEYRTLLTELFMFIRSNKYNNLTNLTDLGGIFHHVFPFKPKMVYRGTQISRYPNGIPEKGDALDDLMNGKSIPLTGNREIRSWTSVEYVTRRFTYPQSTGYTLGVKLAEQVNGEDVVLDLSDDNIQQTMGAIRNQLMWEIPPDNDLTKLCGEAMYLINGEHEVLRKFPTTRNISLCKEIVEVWMLMDTVSDEQKTHMYERVTEHGKGLLAKGFFPDKVDLNQLQNENLPQDYFKIGYLKCDGNRLGFDYG